MPTDDRRRMQQLTVAYSNGKTRKDDVKQYYSKSSNMCGAFLHRILVSNSQLRTILKVFGEVLQSEIGKDRDGTKH